jgi:excisionase family DNA binding protein
MSEERFLRLQEVQRMLGVSRSTLWRWQAEHGLKVVRVGGMVRVRESDLQVFLRRHEETPRIEILPAIHNGS